MVDISNVSTSRPNTVIILLKKGIYSVVSNVLPKKK